MLKVFAFLTKLPQLDEAAFSAHWREPHGTLTKRIPQIRRYAQNHLIGDLEGLGSVSYSGIATIWIDDLASLAAANQHPDYAKLDADGDELYIRTDLVWLMSEETRLRPSTLGSDIVPAKAILLLQKHGGGTFDQAAMASIADRAAAAFPRASTYYATPIASDQPFAGVIELGFQTVSDFQEEWSAAASALLEDLAEVDRRASRGLLAREERVIWPETFGEAA